MLLSFHFTKKKKRGTDHGYSRVLFIAHFSFRKSDRETGYCINSLRCTRDESVFLRKRHLYHIIPGLVVKNFNLMLSEILISTGFHYLFFYFNFEPPQLNVLSRRIVLRCLVLRQPCRWKSHNDWVQSVAIVVI
jgi:hypothetical protein